MRIHIITNQTKSIVPYNYQPVLTGALHKWLGKNRVHDDISLYSFSWLQGGKASKSGIKFENGANFFISAYDESFIQTIINGIKANPEIGYDLSVREIIIQEDPVFNEEVLFFCASPVLIKRRIDDKDVHYTFNDEKCNLLMTETLKNKMKKAGLSPNAFNVEFDKNYQNAKTKLIYYNNIGNKVNICPIRITGSLEQLTFAWNVGVGNSTGIGFGALK